jgi:hypothetical protein
MSCVYVCGRQALLITIVGGLGMLTIATIITDSLAIYVLPERKTYSEYSTSSQCCRDDYMLTRSRGGAVPSSK